MVYAQESEFAQLREQVVRPPFLLIHARRERREPLPAVAVGVLKQGLLIGR